MSTSPKTDVKELAKAAIDALPNDSTWEDVFYTLHVRKKIEAGLEDAESGQMLSNDEVKQLLNVKK